MEAYQGVIEGNHIICPSCPDVDQVERTVHALEWNRHIDRILEGLADYERRKNNLYPLSRT